MKKCFLLLLLTAIHIGVYCQNNKPVLRVTDLICEYQSNPTGLETKTPQFSWKIQSDKRNAIQKSYRILVASSKNLLDKNKGDMWDAISVSSENTFLAYKGKPLKSHQKFFWKVKVSDNHGNESNWSAGSHWTMGILDQKEWTAKWITDGVERNTLVNTNKGDKVVKSLRRNYLPVSYMRKDIKIEKKITKAVAYISAFGLYEASINGRRCGNDNFTPGWSQYDKRVYYNSYDVTNLITEGKNTLAATVGDGWYVQRHGGESIGFLMQLNITYNDGTSQSFGTDKSWKVTNDTPLRMSDIFNGEAYESKKEIPGWKNSDFNDATWANAIEVDKSTVIKTSYYGGPIRKIMKIEPVSITETKSGSLIFNFGQNFSGWARFKLKKQINNKIELKYAEAMNPDGSLYTENLRTAQNKDIYSPKGVAGEEWEPMFTYRGFQYIEVKGCNKDDIALSGIVMHSDLKRTGFFECGDQRINKLYNGILWSQRSNFFDVPTDCPQRDERMGWTGDMQVFQKTASYNMDIGAFTSRWLLALNDGQSKEGGYADFAPLHDLYGTAGWADAGLISPITQYKMYGDKAILEKWYINMSRYIDYTVAQSSGFIRKPSCWPGDWLSVNAPLSEGIITNMYFAYSAHLMSEIAGILGKKADSLKYEVLFQNIKSAYIKKYIDENNTIEGNTQTSYILSLAFDLVDQKDRAVSFQKLIERIQERDYHVSTGFLGVKHLFEVLTEFDRSDVAYRLLKQDTYPGWLYNVSKGANTIWEAWDTWKPGVGWQDHSLNHFNFGAVGEWMYSGMGGIKPLEPGFRKISIEPQIDKEIKFVNASYNSIQGKIVSNWLIENNTLSIKMEIPANTSANVTLPINPKLKYTITESGKSIIKDGFVLSKSNDAYQSQIAEKKVKFAIGSGIYNFKISYSK